MAVRHSAETVGCAFTSQYYQVLYQRPEDTHKFYKDSSIAGWEGKDGIVHSVTTMKGINEMIMSSDYMDSEVQVKDVYAQDSLQGSILLVVTGDLIGNDEVTRKFSHTFLLARQERGFFVLNDILRFIDIHPSTHEAVAGSLHKVPDSPLASNSESKGANAQSALNPSYAEITAETISKPSAGPVAKDVVHKTTYLETLSKERSGPRAPAVQIVRVSASDGSLVATRVQAPASNVAITGKISRSTSVSKTATPSSDETTTQATRASNGIYVGGLPPNTTKHELAEAVKIFGRVKKTDGVQVIQDNKNEDGFIYGFVHFESEESARRAVEAHNITVRGKEAYITYKKSSMNGGSSGRGRSPSSRGGFRHVSPSGKGAGSYNGNHNLPENSGGAYQHDRNRSSEGRDRDGCRWKWRMEGKKR